MVDLNESNTILSFQNKRVLLLQGPAGPFFKRLSADLQSVGATVFKINFNGGDFAFYPNGHLFLGYASEFKCYLSQFLEKHQVDAIGFFGDCRSMHLMAKEVAEKKNIDVYVFEEGYLRPNHITIEQSGVNGFSLFPKMIQEKWTLRSFNQNQIAQSEVVELGNTFWYAALWAVVYYIASSLLWLVFFRYEHHRPLTIREAWPWVRSVWRKQVFRFKERGVQARLTSELSGRYYLVPLQVHNDAQVLHHSGFLSVEAFIETVACSFARSAPDDIFLVVKQHPFDRGYKDYSAWIAGLASRLNIQDRVLYIHDQHLPSLLQHALGVVVINSTVGLSAVEQLKPVKVCGEAVYNVPHITAQCGLDEFFRKASDFTPNVDDVIWYVNELKLCTQKNGSFYKRMKQCRGKAGVFW